MIWPKGAPCTKFYTDGGKHAVRGPAPEFFQMFLAEIFESESGYQTWLTKLETCQLLVALQYVLLSPMNSDSRGCLV